MVLIIDSNKRNAEAISDIFYYMGILSRAASPSEALAEISSIYKAVLISDPEKLPDLCDFTSKLTNYADVSLYSISDNPSNPALRDVFRRNYHSSSYSSVLAADIAEDLRSRNLTPIGSYMLAGIDASCARAAVTSLDLKIPFTKTEVMILRYLIASYPLPQSAKRILRYSFKQNRLPDITSIRTHISVMNKKFREVRGRNVILSIPEKGYVISTPEILKSMNKPS